MVAKVDLANMALDALAVDNIASIDEASTAARAVKRRIDGAIDAVLQMSDWTFARKIEPLAEVSNTDWTERYERKFDLPSDLLRAVRIVPYTDVRNTPPIEYVIANGALYCDEQQVRLQYTFRNTNIASWSPAFTECVAFYLARAIAMPLTRKRQTFADMAPREPQRLEAVHRRFLVASAVAVEGLVAGVEAAAVEFDASQEVTFWAYPSEYLTERGAYQPRGDSRGADGSTYWSY